MSDPGLILDAAWRAAWQGSALVLVALALSAVLRRHLAPGWRYGLWLVVLLRFALPIQITLPWSPWTMAPMPALGAPAEGITLRIPDPQRTVAVPAGVASPMGHDAVSWRTVLAVLWVGGALIGLGLMTLSWWRLRQRLGRAATDASLEEAVIWAAQTAGLRRIPAVRCLPDLACPAAFGIIRPVILVPAGLSQRIAPQDLTEALLHECTHLRRHDVTVAWLATGLLCLHWWNPLAWLAIRRLRSAQELACDATVLAQGTDARSYAGTLLHLAESAASLHHPFLAAGTAGARDDLMERITMIQHPPSTSPLRHRLGHLVLAVLALTVVISSPERTLAAEPPPTPQAAAVANPTATLDITPALVPDPRESAFQARLRETRVTCDYIDRPLPDILKDLSARTDITITTIAASASPVTFKVRDMRLCHVLDFLRKLTSTTLEVRAETVVLRPGPEVIPDQSHLYDLGPFTESERQTLPELVRKTMAIRGDASAVTLHGPTLAVRAPATVQSSVDRLLLALARRQEIPLPQLPAAIRTLRSTKASLVVADIMLEDAVARLRLLTQANIIVDPRLINHPAQLRINAVDQVIWDILEQVCAQVDCQAIVMDQSIFLTTRDFSPPYHVVVQRLPWPTDARQDARLLILVDKAVSSGQASAQRWGDLLVSGGDEAFHQDLARGIAHLNATPP